MKIYLQVLALALLLPLGAAHAANASTADEVLQRHIEALGGHDKLARIQTRVMEAKISVGWFSAKMKSRLIRPNIYEAEATILGQGGGSGYDGTTGWVRKGSKISVAPDKELKRMLRGNSLDWDRKFKQFYPTRRLLPDETVDGKGVKAVELIADNGDREIWRFDTATGLLKQLETTKQDEENPEPVKIISNVSDYREVGGILVAHKIAGLEGKREFSMELLSVVFNQPVAPIRFPGTK